MIYGIGNDLIEIARVLKACERESFTTRIYTENERREASEHRSRLADDFAVKEAVVKAFGTGFVGISPIDIEVLRNGKGAPYVLLHGAAADYAAREHITKVHVSISNTDIYANAVAVCECGQD